MINKFKFNKNNWKNNNYQKLKNKLHRKNKNMINKFKFNKNNWKNNNYQIKKNKKNQLHSKYKGKLN